MRAPNCQLPGGRELKSFPVTLVKSPSHWSNRHHTGQIAIISVKSPLYWSNTSQNEPAWQNPAVPARCRMPRLIKPVESGHTGQIVCSLTGQIHTGQMLCSLIDLHQSHRSHPSRMSLLAVVRMSSFEVEEYLSNILDTGQITLILVK